MVGLTSRECNSPSWRPSLKKQLSPPVNGWLESMNCRFGVSSAYFQRLLAVSFGEGNLEKGSLDHPPKQGHQQNGQGSVGVCFFFRLGKWMIFLGGGARPWWVRPPFWEIL